MLLILHLYISSFTNKQHFIRCFKSKPDKCVQSLQKKYDDVIEALQKHSDSMAKYISNDAFVSMTDSRSSQS